MKLFWTVAFSLLGLMSHVGVARAEAGSVDVPTVVAIPAGAFIVGSDRAEREMAYVLDELAYGHQVTRTRKWYEREPARQEAETGAFSITTTPITQHQYAQFVRATGHRMPHVTAAVWAGYGLIHPYERALSYMWKDGPPSQRLDHPVVLVSRTDAQAYAAWLSAHTGIRWRLPTEREWEKAARGIDGRYFPWGSEFSADKLNSHDAGPFATTSVGTYAEGGSPFGMLDAAGQVFEWTRDDASAGRGIVKGGSWDDKGCGVCRPAARHSRPVDLKHILIGFRLVHE